MGKNKNKKKRKRKIELVLLKNGYNRINHKKRIYINIFINNNYIFILIK